MAKKCYLPYLPSEIMNYKHFNHPNESWLWRNQAEDDNDEAKTIAAKKSLSTEGKCHLTCWLILSLSTSFRFACEMRRKLQNATSQTSCEMRRKLRRKKEERCLFSLPASGPSNHPFCRLRLCGNVRLWRVQILIVRNCLHPFGHSLWQAIIIAL